MLPDIAHWAFTSPRRLAILAGLLIAGVVTLAQLSSSPDPSRTTTAAPAPTETTISVQREAEATIHRDEAPSPAEPTVAAFLTAWLATDQPQQNWLAALRPYITEPLATGLAATDPARIPTGPVLHMRPVLAGE